MLGFGELASIDTGFTSIWVVDGVVRTGELVLPREYIE